MVLRLHHGRIPPKDRAIEIIADISPEEDSIRMMLFSANCAPASRVT